MLQLQESEGLSTLYYHSLTSSSTKRPNRYSEPQLQLLSEFYATHCQGKTIPHKNSMEFQKLLRDTSLTVKQVRVYCWNKKTREYHKKEQLLQKAKLLVETCKESKMHKILGEFGEDHMQTEKELNEVEETIKTLAEPSTLSKVEDKVLEEILQKKPLLVCEKYNKFRWSHSMNSLFLRALASNNPSEAPTPEKTYKLMEALANPSEKKQMKEITKRRVAIHLQKYRKRLRKNISTPKSSVLYPANESKSVETAAHYSNDAHTNNTSVPALPQSACTEDDFSPKDHLHQQFSSSEQNFQRADPYITKPSPFQPPVNFLILPSVNYSMAYSPSVIYTSSNPYQFAGRIQDYPQLPLQQQYSRYQPYNQFVPQQIQNAGVYQQHHQGVLNPFFNQ